MQNHMACKGFCGLVPLDLLSIPASFLTHSRPNAFGSSSSCPPCFSHNILSA